MMNSHAAKAAGVGRDLFNVRRGPWREDHAVGRAFP